MDLIVRIEGKSLQEGSLAVIHVIAAVAVPVLVHILQIARDLLSIPMDRREVPLTIQHEGEQIAALSGQRPRALRAGEVRRFVALALPAGMGEIEGTAQIGNIGGKYAHRIQFVEGELLSAVHGVVDFPDGEIRQQRLVQAVHHEPAQGILIVEEEILLLLPIIEPGDEGGIRRPVYSDGRLLHGRGVQREIQPCPQGQRLRQGLRRQLRYGRGFGGNQAVLLRHFAATGKVGVEGDLGLRALSTAEGGQGQQRRCQKNRNKLFHERTSFFLKRCLHSMPPRRSIARPP